MQATEVRRWVNPSILKWARERIGIQTQQVEDLAKERGAKIKSEDLIAWESDQAEPGLSDLEVLAEIYACPVGYFTLESPPKDELQLNFRGLVSDKIQTLSYESRLQLQRFLSFTEYLGILMEQLNRQISGVNRYSLSDDILAIAYQERERLGISLDARASMGYAQNLFEVCRRKLENLGIFILSLKLNPREIRGASRWDPPGPPSILVNQADAEADAGRIFTLLHEYGHLLIRQAGVVCDFRGQDKKTEIFCNRFAAEVLVPRKEFKQYLEKEGLLQKHDQWGDLTLDKIRKPFLVSRDVVAILLEDMNLARSGFYSEKACIWDSRKLFFKRSKSSPGYRRTKMQLIRNKLGDAFTNVIITGHKQGIVSTLDLAELLDTKIEKVDEFISWAQKS